MQSSCISDADIHAFLRRDLAPQRLLECSDHIAECDICRDKIAHRQGLASAKSRVEEELSPLVDHVPEEDIQRYVAGRLRLSRVAEIDGHLAKCAQCAGEIRDLRNFVASQSVARPFYYRKEFLSAAAAVLVLVAIVFAVARRPRELVSLNDVSGTVSIARDGTLHGIGSLNADEERSVRQALIQQRLSLPASLRELNQKTGVLMGAAEAGPLQVVSPVGTVVQSQRPTMSWTPDPASHGYRVTLKDQNTGAVKTTPLLQGTSWTVPSDLERGHVYDWQVISLDHGKERIAPAPPSPPASFAILNEQTNSKLQRLPASRLVRAVVYADAGLLDDAERELRALQNENPKSLLVQNLLDQLRQFRSK